MRPHRLRPRPRRGKARVLAGPLINNGGPVQDAPRVYVDFWHWTSDPSGEQPYLRSFLSSVGGTPWLATVDQYGASGNSALSGVWSDPAAIPASPARTPFDASAAALVEELRPAVVSFHLGVPEPALLARVRATGATILACATTVAEAQFLERAGVDAVIVQGLEAGGHRSHFLSDDLTLQSGLFALLPQVVAAVGIPVIATGGIADAAGVAGARALGAAMVQIGTGYLLCPEATTRQPHRDALVSESALHTKLTRLFSGGPARGIVNRLMRELGDSADVPQFPYATTAIAPLRAAAEARGSGDFSPLWCGQNASGCRALPSGEVTRALAGV